MYTKWRVRQWAQRCLCRQALIYPQTLRMRLETACMERVWNRYPRTGYVAVRAWLASEAALWSWQNTRDRLTVLEVLSDPLVDSV